MPGCFHIHIHTLVLDEMLEEKELFFSMRKD